MPRWVRTGDTPSMKRSGNGGTMSAVDRVKAGQLEHGYAPHSLSPYPSEWSDRDFREAFESLRIPNEMFHHHEHIRLAWIYSRHFPHEQALTRMVQGIRAFAEHHGAASKYHHTITVAWMPLVSPAARLAPPAPNFNTFPSPPPPPFT